MIRISGLTTKKHKLVYAIIFLFPLILTLIPHQAHAWTGDFQTPSYQSYIEQWDWPRAMSKGYIYNAYSDGDYPPATYPDFDPENTSYIIVQKPTGSTDLIIYFTKSDQDKIIIKSDENGNYITSTRADGLLFYAQIADRPKTFFPNNYYLDASDSNSTTTKIYSIGYPLGSNNIAYDSTYSGRTYNNKIGYTSSDSPISCSPLDFGCWITKAFDGVTDTLKKFGQAMLKPFVWLWIPDTTQIKAQFDDTNAMLIEKLGFLSFPFVFLGDVISAFTNNTLWCTDGNCKIDTGNLFGSNFTIDIMALKNMNSDLYNATVIIMRGVLIMITISAVYHAYMRVIRA